MFDVKRPQPFQGAQMDKTKIKIQKPLWERLWELFEEYLFHIPSGPELFNQYSDTNPSYDLPDAARIRRENLKNYLKCYKRPPKILLVGEAAGPWGCRFSGIPFTSESQLLAGVLPFKGEKTSNHETPYKENSGEILWGALLPEFPRFFLWNAVPLHPHKEGDPLTIRTPGQREIEKFCPLLKRLFNIIGPRHVIAVGRKAQSALGLIGVPCAYVRHPAQSGAREFRAGINEIFARKKNPAGEARRESLSRKIPDKPE